MAITIEQAPNMWNRRKSKIILIASSTNTGQPNFRYYVEVVEGTSLTPFATFLIQPNPAGRLVFDLAGAIGDRVQVDDANVNGVGFMHDLPTQVNFIFGKSSKNFKDYSINVFEYYGTPPAVDPATEQKEKCVVIDGMTPVSLGPGYDLYTDYGSTSSNNAFWFTNSRSIKASQGDRACMAFINNINATLGTANAVAIEYTLYNNTTVVATENILLNTTNGTILPSANFFPDGKVTYMGVLPDNLSDADSPLTPANVPNVNTWTHYTLRPTDGFGVPWGQPLTITNTPHPCKHDPAALVWSNDLGGWDYFRFDGRITTTPNGKAKTYEKLVGSYAATEPFTYNTFDRGTTDYYVERSQDYTLRSGYVTELEKRLISNIAKSRNIYLYYRGWKPVNLKSGSVPFGENYSKAQFVTITVSASNDDY